MSLLVGRNEMTDKKIAMTCGHCGHKAVFELCGEYTNSHEEYREDVYSDERSPYPEEWYRYTCQLFKCPHCSRPTLKEISDSAYQDEPEHKIIYPVINELTGLPKRIAKRYQIALKVQYIEPSAFAVQIGRTLEAVCNYEKMPGQSLGRKLSNLVREERIPPTLAQMAQQLTKLRNLGAHDDQQDDVTEEDVPIMRDFVEAILEYLYVAPAKIARVQARLKDPKGER